MSEYICPFCNDTGFDLLGLKNHLDSHCEEYSALSNFLCNIGDTLRSRGIAAGKPMDERVIELAQKYDALRIELEESNSVIVNERRICQRTCEMADALRQRVAELEWKSK